MAICLSVWRERCRLFVYGPGKEGVVVVVTSSFFEDGDKISQIIVLLH